ncbi:MAG: deoxyribonuclease IV [Gemmatimonadota bacterium]
MDLLGAHVSIAGGIQTAPARAAALGVTALQMFTKQPRWWKEPEISEQQASTFREERDIHRIEHVAVHASYLINSASPDAQLWKRSLRSLIAELERCHAIGADYLVIHPGSATDGDRLAGLRRNADAVARAITDVRPETTVLMECTTGRGNVLGGDPHELGEIITRVRESGIEPSDIQVCLDSCHMYSFGFDLRREYCAAMEQWDEALGLHNVALWHMNDSQGTLGSTVDRHAHIGQGAIGPEGFFQIVTDPRWAKTPMLLETPKDSDPVLADRRNIAALRSLRETGQM